MKLAATAAVFAGALTWACSGGLDIGERCQDTEDCASHLQCLDSVCGPRCDRHEDCGDGYLCEEDGLCSQVQSEIGAACGRERDCGPGQTCTPSSSDADGDRYLEATCQRERPGKSTAASCDADGACRSGTCILGRCIELCRVSSDCPGDLGLECVALPRLIPGGDAFVQGCLQESGVLAMSIPAESPSESLRVPVPGNALSFTLVTRVSDPSQTVGPRELTAPSGELLYRAPVSPGGASIGPIRFSPQPGLSTLLVPNTDQVALRPGIYDVEVEVTLPQGTPGTAVPDIEVFYKLDAGGELDLHFYFLDLEDHPCRAAFAGDLDAAHAPDHDAFQVEYLGELGRIFESAGIALGAIHYTDLSRPDLDGLHRSELSSLLSLSTNDSGIAVFVVRSIEPTGIQALAGSTPGPPIPGTRASGVAIAAETLCYRDYPTLARVTAHALATQMGLYFNRSPQGEGDPIGDSDDRADNLMHFGEFGGTELSPGQRDVLGRYPGLD